MRSIAVVSVAASLAAFGAAILGASGAAPAGAAVGAHHPHKDPKKHRAAAHHAATHHAAAHHAASPVPLVEHATTLRVKPVIRADKARAPKKVLTRNLVTGSGTAVTATSTVTVKYVGVNYKTGKAFTQVTWQTGKATSFTLHHVVPGFSAGLVGMKVGGRREIVIPSKYGYKNLSSGPIKPYETLVFVVDLQGVS